jgi:hypothetical protein
VGRDQRSPQACDALCRNTGEKLSPQLVSTLTEPFQRGTERLRNDHAGVGVGLAIVKSITQAHDGTLTPRAAGGLHVTVQLPATPTRTGRLNHPGSGQPALRIAEVSGLAGEVADRSGLTVGFSLGLASAPRRRHDPGVTLVC